MTKIFFIKRTRAWIDRKYRFLQQKYYKDKFMQVIFSEIKRKNMWKGEESVSGPGSSLSQTKVIRRELPKLFKNFGIKSILDIPCGDFYWMNKTDLSQIEKYIGGDIIKELVDINRKRYDNKKISFKVIDITKDKLPNVDLLLVRDCLVHFSYEDYKKAINNLKKSKSKYLLTTTFVKRKTNENIITGYWRPINLQKEPFLFPKPIFLLNEKCTEAKGAYSDKSLGLWWVKDLPTL